MAINIHNLNRKTKLPLAADAARESAGRCFAILVSCDRTRQMIGKVNPTEGLTADAQEQLTNLLLDLLFHGQQLDQDIATLAAMLGCTLEVVPTGEVH